MLNAPHSPLSYTSHGSINLPIALCKVGKQTFGKWSLRSVTRTDRPTLNTQKCSSLSPHSRKDFFFLYNSVTSVQSTEKQSLFYREEEYFLFIKREPKVWKPEECALCTLSSLLQVGKQWKKNINILARNMYYWSHMGVFFIFSDCYRRHRFRWSCAFILLWNGSSRNQIEY